jgi:hypothetical protein
MRKKNYDNVRFGRLLVLGDLPSRRAPSQMLRMFLARCDCGFEGEFIACNIYSGHTKSCRHCAPRIAGETRRRGGSGVSNINAVLNGYRKHAKAAGRCFDLTNEQFFCLTQSDCHYCGAKPSNVEDTAGRASSSPTSAVQPFVYSGLDRVDSSKGYELSNVVPCCKRCNSAKSDMPQDEFLGHIASIYNHIFGQNSFRKAS